ncbi:hypothetical protein ACVDFE_32840 [Lentzea chajnantorensis]
MSEKQDDRYRDQVRMEGTQPEETLASSDEPDHSTNKHQQPGTVSPGRKPAEFTTCSLPERHLEGLD